MTHSARLLFYWKKKKKKNHSMCVAGYAPSWSENPLSLQVHKPASWSRKVQRPTEYMFTHLLWVDGIQEGLLENIDSHLLLRTGDIQYVIIIRAVS